MLGRGEHDRLHHVDVAQQRVEQAVLVVHVIGKQQALLDLGFLLRRGCNFNALRVVGQFARQVADHAVERGREQQRLALGRATRGDGFDVVDKAHVEHAVGLVQHQHFQAREVDLAALQVVDQAAGGRHHHIDRLRQALQLQAVGRAADQAGGAEAAQLLAIGHGGFLDLQREFARRSQHQHARTHALDRRLGLQTLDRRQQKRRRLAAAGIRRHQQIAPGQRRGNRLRLDRGGVFVARSLHGFKDEGVKPQFGKAHGKPFSVRASAQVRPASGIRQTGHKIRTGNNGVRRIDPRTPGTGRVDHIGANHKTCHGRCKPTGRTKERSKTMGLCEQSRGTAVTT